MPKKPIVWICLFVAVLLHGIAAQAKSQDNDPSSIFPVVSKINIEVETPPGSEIDWSGLAGNLIFLKEGGVFSSALLEESLAALKQSGRFREINVDSKVENQKITLFFHLKPFQLIKDIQINGQYPLFERDVLNAMTIYTGDSFIRDELSKQAALIAEIYQREGFLAPKIKVTGQEDPSDGHFIIHVKIDKGSYMVLYRLKINGNRVLSESRLKSRMKTWRSSILPGSPGRFIEKDLQKDIENLMLLYRKKGYADAVLEPVIEKDLNTNRVSVSIQIDEGSRYEAQFAGNENFPQRTLEKDLVFFTEGNKRGRGVRKSIRKIKERYTAMGYSETRVTAEERAGAEGEKKSRVIRFIIDEGSRAIVESIRISGNQFFHDDKIKKQMLTREPGFREKGVFVRKNLETDLEAIKSLYFQHGFMDTVVKEELKWSKDKSRVRVDIHIDEKPQTIVSSVRITGLTVIEKNEAYQSVLLKAGKPFRKYLVQSDENVLSALVSEKGYPHAKVKGKVEISGNRTQAKVVYHVEEGPFVQLGQIYCKGNFRTKDKIIQRELAMKPGDPFSLTKMLKGQRSLRNLEIFDSVRFKPIGLREKKEKINLFIEVEEKKPYFLEIGAGYETDTGLFVHTKAGDHNLFGTDKLAWAGFDISEIGYRADMGITEKRLLGYPIASNFGLYTERREEFNQEFGTRTIGSAFGLSTKLFQNVTTGLNLGFERRDQFATSSDQDCLCPPGNETFDPRTVLIATPSIIYDTRDSFIRPRKGAFSSLAVSASKGLEDSADDFIKYCYDLRFYWTPISRLTLAWIGRIGYIDPYGPEERVPEDQLFFLGGISDVRGYEENLLAFDAAGNAVGGRSAISGSMEARIDLGYDFEMTLFYDIGRVSETYCEIVSDGFRPSLGTGLRYITPIGPVGFLFGMNLDRKKGEKSGVFHFSFGYTF
jgi:outer membrane protein insertion porin family